MKKSSLSKLSRLLADQAMTWESAGSVFCRPFPWCGVRSAASRFSTILALGQKLLFALSRIYRFESLLFGLHCNSF